MIRGSSDIRVWITDKTAATITLAGVALAILLIIVKKN